MKTTLTKFEQMILTLLQERKGEIVTRKDIRDRLFGQDEPTYSNLVDTHMKNLRRKLPKSIEITTVRRKGYQINT